MNTQTEMDRQKIEKTLSKLEWLLARSEQSNCRYSRAQMEAFAILQDRFRGNLDDINDMVSDNRADRETGICHV